MVLQTSCRCLRQVTKNSQETALIWLNTFNAEKLNRQLQQQQNITLKEFGCKPNLEIKQIDRFSRMKYLQVPTIDFYQLKVSYETLIIDDANNPTQRLRDESILALADISLIHQQDMEGNLIGSNEQKNNEEVRTSFHWWLHQIAKESFGMLKVVDLKKCEAELQSIFAKITTEKNGALIERFMLHQSSLTSLAPTR